MPETDIERRGLPAIRLSQIADRLSESPQSLLRVIGRTVIHHQNLAFLERKILRQRARHGLFNVLPVIVSIDQDGEIRGFHAGPFRLTARWHAATSRVVKQ